MQVRAGSLSTTTLAPGGMEAIRTPPLAGTGGLDTAAGGRVCGAGEGLSIGGGSTRGWAGGGAGVCAAGSTRGSAEGDFTAAGGV